MDSTRVDRWLWAVRLTKTRPDAAAAVRRHTTALHAALAWLPLGVGAVYGDAVAPLDQPIRADLLGNMWAQDWTNIYPLVAPPKSDPGYDLTKVLVARKFDEKKRFLVEFGEYLRSKPGGGHTVVGGNWNIAPAENDLKAFKTNKRSPGFQPHEREWVAGLLDCGWVDVTRELTGDVPGPYTWWSWRGKSFDNDAGWRIDYHLVTPELAARAAKSYVHRAQAYDLRWSDHSAVTTVFS
mgnify:CR=1 FL=1